MKKTAEKVSARYFQRSFFFARSSHVDRDSGGVGAVDFGAIVYSGGGRFACFLWRSVEIFGFPGSELATFAAGLSGNCESGKYSSLIRIRKVSVVH